MNDFSIQSQQTMKRKTEVVTDDTQAEKLSREVPSDDKDALFEAFMDSVEDGEEISTSSNLTHAKEEIAISQNEDISQEKSNGAERELDMNEVEQASYEARIGKLITLSRGKNNEVDLNDATDFGSRFVTEDTNESIKLSDNLKSISYTDLLRKKKKQRKHQEEDFNDDINWF
jgi:hypothetical protein